MKEIPLTRGYIALVDDIDFTKVGLYKWQARVKRREDGSIKKVYAGRGVKVLGRDVTILMHRFILGMTDPKQEIDHKDHNGLNNQRYNLRQTRGQNQQNVNVRKDNTSGFKGVTWHKEKDRWVAQIVSKTKHIYLGSFTDPLEAACAYDMAAVKYHGEFASTNFVEAS